MELDSPEKTSFITKVIMNTETLLTRVKFHIVLTVPLLSLFSFASPTHAEDNCSYTLGRSTTGALTILDLCSIQRQKNNRVNFTYSLSNEPIEAQANCLDQYWISYPEKAINRPKSQATSDMMKIVCTAPSFNDGIGIGVVFDPPSKIRKTPNGEVVCTIQDITAIELSGGVTGGGEWYRTSACGGGVIHKSQIRFN